MIISASRRSDIPAFYARWFIKRIRAGYCTVPNPFNRRQIAHVSLLPEDVDMIVFWTRNPKPLFPYLDELDQRGFSYYFQYTLLGYPRQIDKSAPSRDHAIQTFQELATRIGPQRVIWRYDPIVFSQLTGAQFHIENYASIAEALRGYTQRSVISVMDMYKKFHKRLAQLNQEGVGIVEHGGQTSPRYDAMMESIAQSAHENDMEIFSCSEERDMTSYGILPGKCIDDEFIEQTFGIEVGHKKDPGQRAACGCVISKDIGMYDSCLFGCQYCYATSNFERSKVNYKNHDHLSPSLIGWHEPEKESQ
jgi:hypothetical protein